jgi:hypothetical protein
LRGCFLKVRYDCATMVSLIYRKSVKIQEENGENERERIEEEEG